MGTVLTQVMVEELYSRGHRVEDAEKSYQAGHHGNEHQYVVDENPAVACLWSHTKATRFKIVSTRQPTVTLLVAKRFTPNFVRLCQASSVVWPEGWRVEIILKNDDPTSCRIPEELKATQLVTTFFSQARKQLHLCPEMPLQPCWRRLLRAVFALVSSEW